MKNIVLSFFLLLVFNAVNAQEVIHLWEGQEKPFYKENDLKEYEEEAYGTTCVFDITEPTLTVFKAKGKNTGKAVVIIPGGGYGLVAMYHEGYDLAKALSKSGITAAVLKYRLPNPKSSDTPWLVPITDARRSLKLMRAISNKYGFKKDKVGVMGFSAGGHLATVATLWPSEDIEERPNFSAFIYGVTDLSDANKEWLENDLYYRKMTPEEIEQNTLLNFVSKDTPPAFLVHAYDDDICFIKETTLYTEKMHKVGAAVETHIFPVGGHGFGAGREVDGTNQWVDLFINWTKRLK
ncbi:alpha/beta hydrolase [Flammeovirga kamogawensis]|uniref:Alpha/beta hydrolase n=1 Tax=Flammeovirga kamogawensis TaxID=373891 RepID=A0ABX8GYW9_9BACT|nr:alpha/beta hydrolase [Flammeovirga kamogawensis]MBB6459043.1 acetyl esterase/lipase [Flammeovirga kamogawensis]QWG08613.1 alpha/beta hydrolase [Flammeovirga kamogawensis]TRX66906.1 alpha/beta hydrolase [Flammeovirga kamogawensis]